MVKTYLEMRTEKQKIEIIISNINRVLPSTIEELVAACPEWDGLPPESYDWGEPYGREVF